MSTLKVDKLDPSSGTALEIGSSGDTMTVPSGATFTVAGTLGATSAANLTSIPAANVTGVLPVGVTGGSGLTALGTVTAGTLSSGVHGKVVLEDFQYFQTSAVTSTTAISQSNINISGSSYVTVTTGTSTSDYLEFICDYGNVRRTPESAGQAAYLGFGLEYDDNTSFSSPAGLWRSGDYNWGSGADSANDCYTVACITKMHTVANWGLSASTTYYVRLIGQTYSQAGSFAWGLEGRGAVEVRSEGVRLTYRRWRVL